MIRISCRSSVERERKTVGSLGGNSAMADFLALRKASACLLVLQEPAIAHFSIDEVR